MPAADKARAAADRDGAVSQGFAAPQEEQAAPRVTEDSRVTSLQPGRIDGEVLLVRAVGDGLRQRVQGIWIDHKAMGASLLDAIRDLLPAATLAPYEPFVFTRDNLVRPGATAGLAANRLTAIPRSLEDVPMAMVSMPWVLVPGMAPAPAAAGSALGILLGSAWAGALLAIAAAAFLLRGVLVLSERRAAFVSSVTHELRTPLTTFTLYSEMLADGMVKDPEKQRGYLQTLRTEAARLGHLVENVLAYSRIERGSARTRMEDINIQTLADRLMPRLAERATGVGATIDICLPADLAGRTLTTDASAVEQIVFNLVDNAAKYAPPAAGGPPWQLVFAVARGQLAIDFRDHGPGIPPAGRKRLFRPFHKSAQDAANSKPGVGLGLALSRRLAHALGGSLDLAESSTSGTTFRLVLPMARR
jgi:signal transduction histidine kinase